MQVKVSQRLFAEAQKYIPGGVNSPVRSFRAVEGTPLFITRGEGARIWDADGNEFIDYVGSWGPLVLGHAHPAVLDALRKTAEKGVTFGALVEGEVELARMICQAVPSVETVRLVNSGTEACMSAIRLARAFTGRNKIIKFAGCYHGHADGLLVKAGSGALTHGIATSAGVPDSYAKETLVADYNDLASVERYFDANAGDIAGVIVEPVAGNMGVAPPVDGFLQGLRRLTAEAGALLIFDEVITGFRVSYGGAQCLFGVTPDVTCLGKIIGGGLPVGAYGARRDIMEMVAPLGPMYQAGTLSGNPLAVAAGIATLRELSQPGTYEKLESMSCTLTGGLSEIFGRLGVPGTINRVGSAFCGFFNQGPVENLAQAEKSDTDRYRRYFHAMLAHGVYLAPSQFEAGFVSLAHTASEIDQTLAAAEAALRKVASG